MCPIGVEEGTQRQQGCIMPSFFFFLRIVFLGIYIYVSTKGFLIFISIFFGDSFIYEERFKIGFPLVMEHFHSIQY